MQSQVAQDPFSVASGGVGQHEYADVTGERGENRREYRILLDSI